MFDAQVDQQEEVEVSRARSRSCSRRRGVLTSSADNGNTPPSSRLRPVRRCFDCRHHCYREKLHPKQRRGRTRRGKTRRT